uniref:Growth-regulating factor n=1 Tax=Kalanchoe fedtschenkoi TaxID=63787 RepID=A0A7N0SXS6_KALFE
MSMDLCRPFLSGDGSDYDLGVGISGPASNMNRSCMMMMPMSMMGSSGGEILSHSVAAEVVDVRTKLMLEQQHHQQLQQQQQPFDMYAATCGGSVIKSPGNGGMAAAAAASMGFFPFTAAQWKELERQAMVFKYMMHSIPVPYDLLLPFITATNNDPSGVRRDSHLLRFLKNGDPEPGRCRRTDGKKWRCSNGVALDQKYCEKHVHRGRPRSRKLVEAASSDFNNKSNKKPRPLPQAQPNAPPPAPVSGSQNGAGSDLKIPRSAAVYANAAHGNQPSSVPASLLPQSHPRNNVDWSEGQWNRLMAQSKRGDAPERSHYSNASLYHQQLSLNSYAQFASAHDDSQSKREFELFLNPDLKKPLMDDAWTANAASTHSCNGLVSLGLSMGHVYNVVDEMSVTEQGKQPQMGNWLTQSGGPLGEVLRPTATSSPTTAAASDSCNNKNSPQVTSSSPSGVLQKAVASHSDSTSHSSQPKSGLQWLSQDKLPSSPGQHV